MKLSRLPSALPPRDIDYTAFHKHIEEDGHERYSDDDLIEYINEIIAEHEAPTPKGFQSYDPENLLRMYENAADRDAAHAYIKDYIEND
jgi:hypothetical protein